MTNGGDDGNGAPGERPHDDLGTERQQVVEAAAAAGDDHDVDHGVLCDPLRAAAIDSGAPAPCTRVSVMTM